MSEPQRICHVEDVPQGSTLAFTYRDYGIKREGFLMRWQDQWVAYENRCKHLPISLDLGDHRFFLPNRQAFVCQTHGAEYQPSDGLCVRGPCQGAYLTRLNVIVSQNALFLEGEDIEDVALV